MKTLKLISLAMLVLWLCSSQVQAQQGEVGIHMNLTGFFEHNDLIADRGHVGDKIYYKVKVFTQPENFPIRNGDPNLTLPELPIGTFIDLEPGTELELEKNDEEIYWSFNYLGGVYTISINDLSQLDGDNPLEVRAYAEVNADAIRDIGPQHTGNNAEFDTEVIIPCIEVTKT